MLMIKDFFREKLEFFTKNYKRYLAGIWLSVVLILVFVLQNYFFNHWLGIPYLIRNVAASGALGVLLFGPAIFFKKRNKYIYLIGISIIVAFIFVAQFLYFSYSGGFLQSSALRYLGLVTNTGGTIKTILTYRLLAFVFVPLLLVVLAYYRRKSSEIIFLMKEKIVAGLIMVAIIILGYGFVFYKEYSQVGNVRQLYRYSMIYNVDMYVAKIGIMNFTTADMINSVIKTNKVTATDVNFIKQWANSSTIKSVPENNFGLAKGRNIIFLQVESLESAVINQYVYGQEATPRLNQLVREGVYFSNHYDLVGPGTTADTEFSVLNSLYSLPDSVAFVNYASNKYLALPQLLKERGYHSYVLHSDVPSFWNRVNMYPQLGYDKAFSSGDFNNAHPADFDGLPDHDLFVQSIPKLKSLPQPFLATVITLTSHTPFALPDNMPKLGIPVDGMFNYIQLKYLQNIYYVDAEIGFFIDQLKEAGLYNNSLILIYGDHGSSTNIGSALGLNSDMPIKRQNKLVPLIIVAPGTPLKGIVEKFPSSHLDIYPTVANLVGLTPPKTVLGQDLLNTKEPFVVLRNSVSGTIRNVLTDKLEYVANDEGLTNGVCTQLPSKQIVSVDQCKAIYDKAINQIKISDLLIRGNMMKKLPIDFSTTP